MLTRRQFGLGMGAAIGGALVIRDLHDARGAEPIVIKLGSSLGLYELPNAGWMCGLHKRLGYYAEEGVSVDYIATGNAANSFQALVTGDSDYGLVLGSTLLPFLAQNPDADIVSIYAVIPQPFWYVAVKPDSPVKELIELKGKSIGIVNRGPVRGEEHAALKIEASTGRVLTELAAALSTSGGVCLSGMRETR